MGKLEIGVYGHKLTSISVNISKNVCKNLLMSVVINEFTIFYNDNFAGYRFY
jgi:hypothetical protein